VIETGATNTYRPGCQVKRILAGSGMVRPRPGAVVRIDGQVLDHRHDRIAPDHPVVVQSPYLFEACDSDDRQTASRMRELTRAKTRAGARPPRTSTSNYGLGLSASPSKDFGLGRPGRAQTPWDL
jgi:hypothetical protein